LGNLAGVNRGMFPSFPQMNLRKGTKEEETRQKDRDKMTGKSLKN